MSLTTTPASLTVASGNAPKTIGIAAPVDSSFPEADLRVIVTGLPTDGTVYLADGVTPVIAGEYLSAVQLTGLTFAGSAAGTSSLTYTAIEPRTPVTTSTTVALNGTVTSAGTVTGSGTTYATGTVSLTVTANTNGPVTTAASLTVDPGATATSIGIVAPTDPTDPPSSLTVTVLGLPEYGLPVSGTPTSIGTVTLSDGVTPVTVGETLTVAQLTGLMFTPTTGDAAFSSQFSYTVTDTSGNSSLGTAELDINPAGGTSTIRTVGFTGPGGVSKQYSTIALAVAAAVNGDTIQVKAGTYTVSSDIKIGGNPGFGGTPKNITLEGVGGMVNVVNTGVLSKGILVTNGNDTINNFSFSRATTLSPSSRSSANGAGIVYESGNLVLDNDYFFNNQDGLRGGPPTANTGSVTVNNSMFANNGIGFKGTSNSGTGSGYTHNLYITNVATLTIDNSYFFNANEGHEIKSRAYNTIIENSVIVDGPASNSSFSIQLPDGGNTTIQNNIIEKGPLADNSAIISYASEALTNPFDGDQLLYISSSLLVTGNTIINDLGTSAKVVDNEANHQASAQGTVSLSGTVMTVNSGVVGKFAVGETLVGTGITTGTTIASLGTGTGGTGTYNLSAAALTETNVKVNALDPNTVTASITGNQFYGLTLGQIASGPGPNTQSGNTLSSIGSAPTLSTTQPFAQVTCFLRGTLILTEVGEVAVEELAIGDMVVTVSGEAKPIRWIGRRAYDGRFIAGNRVVLPIRIAAGALADWVPAQDLWVSPEHALYIDGVLVPARQLVNGATIVPVEEIKRVEYFHIELAAHEIIFAESAPTESFVDCDNRGMFQNAGEVAALYPGDRRPTWEFCAPRLEEASAELPAIRAALWDRAEALGHAFDLDPDLQLIIDGQAIRPSSVVGCRYRFDIPAGSTALWLASRSTVPAETTAASQDIRRLGVAVERIALLDADRLIEAWHSDAALREGFHADEGSHRWTDGLARLPETWLRPFPGGATLEVQLIPSELGYRLPPPASIAAAA